MARINGWAAHHVGAVSIDSRRGRFHLAGAVPVLPELGLSEAIPVEEMLNMPYNGRLYKAVRLV